MPENSFFATIWWFRNRIRFLAGRREVAVLCVGATGIP